jgi:hypothetical protein
VGSSSKNKHRRPKWWRIAALLALALLLLGLIAAAGYYVFTGWRARDLAAKAENNFEQANYRLAWLQLQSAKNLRPGDSQVLRAAAKIEAAFGQATAMDRFEQLAGQTNLTPEDLQARAEIATRFGTDGQFTTAVEELASAGRITEAGQLRAARQLRRGDLDRAIAETRGLLAEQDDPALRLMLAELLVRRYGPEFGPGRNPSAEALAGAAEAGEIVDALLDTPQRDAALAFALNDLNALPVNRQRWAEEAMGRVERDNPALLPAATVLVRSGKQTPQQIHEQLRPIFDGAPLDRRAAYALWLTGAGLPREALTLITAQEASESTAAFGARTEALFRTDNPDAVLAAVEAGGNVDSEVRLSAKARAEYARGRGAQGGAAALREAMEAAARAKRLEFLLATGDGLGATTVTDTKLAEMCGDPAVADYVFQVARDRFDRRGRPALLSAAFERAQSAAPQGAGVQDYGRYRRLLDGGAVSLDETAAAVAAEPAKVAFRITHALNLLRNNRPAEALDVFDDITVFADRIPPGQQAVIAAVLSGSGDAMRARALTRAIDADKLAPGEYALIAPLRMAVP